MNHNRRRASDRRARCGRPAAFTLVEILIVVVILGILAAIVIPSFVSAGQDTREGAIKMDLRNVRVQLEIYRNDHMNAFPSLANFKDQMTLMSNITGDTAAVGTPGFPKGPYLRGMPRNPNTGTSTVTAGAVGTSAWYYDETTGEFLANDSAKTRQY